MAFFLTVGAIFVMWLGEQITERGIGNGASLMIFFSIVERIWPGIMASFSFVSTGAVGAFSLLVLIIMMVAVVGSVVAVTMAARRVLIQIPQRTMARGRQREASRSFIPLRINSSGVMPIVFAQSVIVMPGAFAQFMGNTKARDFADMLAPGDDDLLHPVGDPHHVLHVLLHVDHLQSDRLGGEPEEAGWVHPGVKPGAKTAEYIDDVVSKITLPGALFPHGGCLAADLDFEGDQRSVQLRWNVAAHRGRRRAGHDSATQSAPAAPQVRRLHEEGKSAVPRQTGSAGRILIGC
jgi:preprotein translocase subunit SecY